MSFFDRFLSAFRGGGDQPSRAAPPGPLGLVIGDLLVYYQDSFRTTGLRLLNTEGTRVFQYCLKDEEGNRAVLVAEDCAEPVFTLQRVVEADLDWNAEVLDDVDEEPFRLSRSGRATLRLYGDTGLNSARSVEYREFEDPGGDRVLVMEDFASCREIRLGEVVLEAEIEINPDGAAPPSNPVWAQLAETARDPGDDTGEPRIAGREVTKGSPMAAVLALSDGDVDDGQEGFADDDVDPEAYVDEEWADAYDSNTAGFAATGEDPVATAVAKSSRKATASTAFDDDDEDWIAG